MHYRSCVNHKNKYYFSSRARDRTKIDLVVMIFMSKSTRALHHIRLFFCFPRFLCSRTNYANKTNFAFRALLLLVQYYSSQINTYYFFNANRQEYLITTTNIRNQILRLFSEYNLCTFKMNPWYKAMSN
jgi:hypothetical protein